MYGLIGKVNCVPGQRDALAALLLEGSQALGLGITVVAVALGLPAVLGVVSGVARHHWWWLLTLDAAGRRGLACGWRRHSVEREPTTQSHPPSAASPRSQAPPYS